MLMEIIRNMSITLEDKSYDMTSPEIRSHTNTMQWGF
nr:MAG TPA: hypothetical protein [Inoviridae sp.]